mmetsp:Transcript_71572/g.149646  ORF Transcript_71572/g.149646 Transcript_71572/m.149646 type:complete len:158 (+) Transcript_71572:211-684(+)
MFSSNVANVVLVVKVVGGWMVVAPVMPLKPVVLYLRVMVLVFQPFVSPEMCISPLQLPVWLLLLIVLTAMIVSAATKVFVAVAVLIPAVVLAVSFVVLVARVVLKFEARVIMVNVRGKLPKRVLDLCQGCIDGDLVVLRGDPRANLLPMQPLMVLSF